MPQNQATFIVHGEKLRMVDGELFGPEELVADLMKAHAWLVETGNYKKLATFYPLSGDLSYWRYVGAILDAAFRYSGEAHIDITEPILENGIDVRERYNVSDDPNILPE